MYQSKGFTLVELLVVITIVAIIASMAVPNITQQIKNTQAKNNLNTMKTFLVNAKQDALIYQNLITVCIADASQSCAATQGTQLISFIDKNNNHQFDSSTDIFQASAPLSLQYASVRLSIALNKQYIDFKPANGNPVGHMGHIKHCPNDGNPDNMFKVSFSKTGIIKVKYNKDEPTGC